MWKKTIAIILGIAITALIVWAATDYRLNAGQTNYITEQGTCKKVVNGGAKDIFIPTKTAGEWSSFYSNTPTGVTASSVACCAGAGTDDATCGTISCAGWYQPSGRTCYTTQSITSSRCEGNENCKDANTADCAGQGTDGLQISCPGFCQTVSGCSETTSGSCGFVPSGQDPHGDCSDANGVNNCNGNGYCDWVSGPCIGSYGIEISGDDLPPTTWKTTRTGCFAPYCGDDGTYWRLVANNGIDFSEYPARDMCKSLGGRLPNPFELDCIFTNRASYPGTFYNDLHWTSAQADTDYAMARNLNTGQYLSGLKDTPHYFRCVRDV